MMTAQSTADIVAWLRGACYYRCADNQYGRCRTCMAADRLEELQASIDAFDDSETPA